MEAKTNFERGMQCVHSVFERDLIACRQPVGGVPLPGRPVECRYKCVASACRLMKRLDAAGVRYRIQQQPLADWWSAHIVLDEYYEWFPESFHHLTENEKNEK